jgi:D-inositol-3-phosphate glycosyltransferase
MKRIALISDHASPRVALGGVDCGGQNEYVRQVAQGLAASGCFVDVFTRRINPSDPIVEQWSPQIRIVNVPAGPATPIAKEELLPHMAEFTQFLLDFMTREGVSYHVMHANFFMSAQVAADVKQATGIPFVVTFHALGQVRRLHQGNADRFPLERIAIEQRVVDEADAVIAECPQDRDDLIEYYGARRNRLRLIPCGVDTERFRPVPRIRARAALGIPNDDFVVLQLGRLVPRKGIDDVIRAVARLRHQHLTDVRLLVVGGDQPVLDERSSPELARLRGIAEQEFVSDLVRFVGQRCGDVLRFYYSAADVFVTTPWYEPFGMTPLEAMACGIPVIGSSVGGIKYTVLNEETGLLVPPRDPVAIANAIQRLVDSPELRAVMGGHGHQRASSAFSWFDVVRSIVLLYDDVAAAARTKRRVASETPYDRTTIDRRSSFDRSTQNGGGDSPNNAAVRPRG